MNTKPALKRSHCVTSFVAATLAGFIAIGILGAVADLFQRSGTPMQRLVVAERACIDRPFVSEREACMREWLASSRSAGMADR